MVASSSPMASKRKQIRKDHARRAQNERQKYSKLREVQCNNAGVPYRKYIHASTAQLTEQPCDLYVPSHLYVLGRSDAPHIFKIGRSHDSALRAKHLGESHCFKVECLLSFDQAGMHELEVHNRLEEYRVLAGQGREWFEAPLELITKTIHEVLERHV